MTSTKTIEVAAAVLTRADGSFLLAQRPAGKPYAGYWEFPGGKIEAGESAYQALCRELHEELGIHITHAYPWLMREFHYPHAIVKLNFFRVDNWQGNMHGREAQLLAWQTSSDITVAPILPANAPILRALSLPPLYAISLAAELGTEQFLIRLQAKLDAGLRLVQLREKNFSREQITALAQRMLEKMRAYDAKLILNADIELAQQIGAHGVQLTARQLAELTVRPDLEWCGASCHDAAELQRAAALGCDFALLSPVLPTQSHPGEPSLGWEKFSAMVADTTIPVYALGGLASANVETARNHGAHGIALLRQAWV